MQPEQVRAIVTGAASGLGRAVAGRLVAQGGRVALFDLDEVKGYAAQAELGGQASFLKTDVSSEDEVARQVEVAAGLMGGLNVVVNCAGILGSGRVIGKDGPMPLGRFTGTVMVNLVGSFNVAKAAAHRMQHNDPGEDGERGVIVNTASIAAFEGQIGQAAYAASKGGIVGMALPMARELARFGIRVMTIAPGAFHTPMVEGVPQETYDSLCAQVPFPSRLGKPEEFADTVAYILRTRYLNASVIRLDGAIRMQPK